MIEECFDVLKIEKIGCTKYYLNKTTLILITSKYELKFPQSRRVEIAEISFDEILLSPYFKFSITILIKCDS